MLNEKLECKSKFCWIPVPLQMRELRSEPVIRYGYIRTGKVSGTQCRKLTMSSSLQVLQRVYHGHYLTYIKPRYYIEFVKAVKFARLKKTRKSSCARRVASARYAGGRGTPSQPSQVWGGVPHPRLGGSPSQVQVWYHILTWSGGLPQVPPIQTWDGVPPPARPGMGYPPFQTWDGVLPPTQTWEGVPPYLDLTGVSPPVEMWTDKQTENSPSPILRMRAVKMVVE